MTFLLSILAISGIAALLAALLVLADRLIHNYGECCIRINDDKELKVEGGSSLLTALVENDIFIPSACGGRGTCAYCKTRVLSGGGPFMPTEEPYLDKQERADSVRLACQVKIKEDLDIVIPEALFKIREYEGVCEAITPLTHDIRAFRIRLPEPMDYVPGQYIQLFCPSYDGNEEVYRAYSIASDPADPTCIDLVMRLVPNGICTTWCFEHLKEGDPVRLNGPYGEFRISNTQAPMIFVAGGSGMAPILNMLYQMKNESIRRKATYFFGANEVGELFYGDLMQEREADLHDFTYVPVVARPGPDEDWAGETGFVTDAIRRQVTDAADCEAYLCGSPGMIDATVGLLTSLGMPESSIFYDKFS